MTGLPLRVWLMPSAFAPHRGGVEELTLKLAQRLELNGHDVLVVTNRWPLDLPSQDVVEGVRVARVPFQMPARRPSSWARYLAARRGTQQALRALGPAPDVIHVICPAGQLRPARVAAGAWGCALVVTSQGETEMDSQQIYRVNPWLRRQLRVAARRAAALTACSEWTRNAAARIAPGFRSAAVILNGVDADDWPSLPAVEDMTVLAWGRHVPQKGFDLLLAAFHLVLEEIPGATLLLGGDGPERSELQRGAGRHVTFLGALDREGVRDALSRTRVVAVPSRIEPFGIVAVEALAAGRGLVHACHGGLGEATGGLGRPVDPTHVTAFAEALVAELRDPTEAADGRARARALDWARLTPQYESVYASAVESCAERRVPTALRGLWGHPADRRRSGGS